MAHTLRVNVFFIKKTISLTPVFLAFFSNTLKFMVKDCDPNTGEADEVGYDDEYVVSLKV
jgi:hypothetical protein